MIDSLSSTRPGEGVHSPPPEESLLELRNLLFGPEKVRIRQVERQLEDPHLLAAQVSRVLPEAVTLCAAQDGELVVALQSTVEDILRSSVKTKPEILIEALFPIIGPAIRKAIANAFRDLMLNFSRTLDASFSPRSIKWRWEALRTGKKFSEVALLHTLEYQVEQVFLIHRNNGLLLEHAVAQAAPSQDPDLVSGMLTAIQDFVKDSFGGSPTEELETLVVGDLTLWIEQGPHAVVAAVVRGNAPPEVREKLKEAVERIHRERASELVDFQGDTSVFAASRHHLEKCLEAQFKEKTADARRLSPAFWAILAILLVVLAGWAFHSWRESSRWAGFLERLEREPGIIVTKAERSGGVYRLRGLRDRLAADPKALFREAGFDPDRLEPQLENYIAVEPELVQKRAEGLLKPPASVSLDFSGNTLKAVGSAPAQWIARAADQGPALPGVEAVDLSGVEDASFREAQRLARSIERRRLFFTVSTAQPLPDQNAAIERLIQDFLSLKRWAEASQGTVAVEIYGNVDQTGPNALNELLKKQRAQTARRILQEAGIESESMRLVVADGPQGEPTDTPAAVEDTHRWNRSASFQIKLDNTTPKR